MYTVIFYRDKNGKSDVEEYIKELSQKSNTSKSDHITYTKLASYIENLTKYGTRIGKPTVKYISDNIWELRPLNNRIFFFYWKDNMFVLLHYYIKKSQKMPKKEFSIAKNRLKDFIERSK